MPEPSAPMVSAVADRVASREILDQLSVTGGVPRYLEEIDPTLSADENIRRLCFQRDGTLFNDFEAIFSQVFGDDCDVKRSEKLNLVRNRALIFL